MIFLLSITVLKLPVLIRAIARFFLFKYINSRSFSFVSCCKFLIVCNLLLRVEFDRCRIELNLEEKRFHTISELFKKLPAIIKTLSAKVKRV